VLVFDMATAVRKMKVKGQDDRAAAQPVRIADRDALDLVDMLKKLKAYGGHEGYFEEYNYEDISD